MATGTSPDPLYSHSKIYQACSAKSYTLGQIRKCVSVSKIALCSFAHLVFLKSAYWHTGFVLMSHISESKDPRWSLVSARVPIVVPSVWHSESSVAVTDMRSSPHSHFTDERKHWEHHESIMKASWFQAKFSFACFHNNSMRLSPGMSVCERPTVHGWWRQQNALHFRLNCWQILKPASSTTQGSQIRDVGGVGNMSGTWRNLSASAWISDDFHPLPLGVVEIGLPLQGQKLACPRKGRLEPPSSKSSADRITHAGCGSCDRWPWNILDHIIHTRSSWFSMGFLVFLLSLLGKSGSKDPQTNHPQTNQLAFGYISIRCFIPFLKHST